MGNNTSTTRKSTAGTRHNSVGVRKALRKEANLDEEFSDLILHEVTKQQQQQQQKQQKQLQQQQQQPQSQSHQMLHSQQQQQHLSEQGLDPQQLTQFTVERPNFAHFTSYGDTPQDVDDEVMPDGTKRRRKSSAPYKQFLNDLIEDEFNELNDGLLETDAPELSRNILHNEDELAVPEDANVDAYMAEADADDEQQTRDAAEYRVKANSVLKPIGSDMETDDELTPGLSKVDFTKIVPQQPQEASLHVAGLPLVSGGEVAKQTTQAQSAGGLHQVSGTSTPTHTPLKTLIPVEIKWVNSTKEPIQKISIIGSFSNWRDVIRLRPSADHPNEYVTTINLPLGVHKLLYMLNNEYRISDQLPTATDQEGIFFNWFEVLDEAHLFNHSHNQPNHIGASTDYDANIIHEATQTAGRYEVDRIKKKSTSFLTRETKSHEQPDFEHVEYLMEDEFTAQPAVAKVASQPLTPSGEGDDEATKYISYQDGQSGSFFTEVVAAKLIYSSEIPEMFVNYDYFKSKGDDYQLPEPPQLPAHLNNVLLNKISSNQNNSHASNFLQTKNPLSGTTSPGATLTTSEAFKPPQPLYHDGGHLHKRPPLRRADSSYYASNQEAYHLSIPNHVILNHLMTTSIRNEVLTVACITRYSGKFVTQIVHSPADTHRGEASSS